MVVATHTYRHLPLSKNVFKMYVYTKEWTICTFYYPVSMHSRPDSHLHSLSPRWVCHSYQELCFSLAWGTLQIYNLHFFSLLCRSVVSPSFFPSLLLSEVTFKSLGLFFLETACSSLPLLLPDYFLLLSLSDFHIFPSAVTISSFLTCKRHIAKHPVWHVNRKLGEKWCAIAIDWFRLYIQTSPSRVAGWKPA